jgi:hypothetical protein
MTTTGLPTLSQIRSWDVDHLIEAAEHWDSTANRWDDVYGQVWQQSLGMNWQGRARDALVDRTTADKAMVSPKSGQLREASLTARKGAGDISAVQRSVLYKIDDARQSGFVVGEDLSVTDTKSSHNAAALAQRQALAQALSADVRSRAAQLIATDSEVGTKLTTCAGDVGSLTFDEKPITYNGKPTHVSADPRNGTIQLVDWKQAPLHHPNLVGQLTIYEKRSRIFPKAAAQTILKSAAPKTYRSSGTGRQRTHRQLHPASHIEAGQAPWGDCPTGRSSRWGRATSTAQLWTFATPTATTQGFTSMPTTAAYQKYHRLPSRTHPQPKAARQRNPHRYAAVRLGCRSALHPTRTHQRRVHISSTARTTIPTHHHYSVKTPMKCPRLGEQHEYRPQRATAAP